MNYGRYMFAGALGAAAGMTTLVACDLPECIDGPSNITPETTASCVAPPEGTEPATEIFSASAETLADGTLVLTWSSWGLACGTKASEVELAMDCETIGWAITAEIPPELLMSSGEGEGDPGTLSAVRVIDFAQHPEIRGTLTVMDEGSGGSRVSFGDEPFFVGSIELIDVGGDCVTGVLRGFGTGDPDPTLGGPELEGSFVAPRC